jgi:hypothetical protein
MVTPPIQKARAGGSVYAQSHKTLVGAWIHKFGSDDLEKLLQHAANHNLRTFSVWKRAVKEVSRELRASNCPQASIVEIYLHDITNSYRDSYRKKTGTTKDSVSRIRGNHHQGQQTSPQGKIEESERRSIKVTSTDGIVGREENDVLNIDDEG